MSETANELIAEIENTLEKLKILDEKLLPCFPLLDDNEDKVSVAVLGFDKFYTICESLFVVIHKIFGNGLARDSWHSDLLRNMNTAQNGRRPAVISDATCSALDAFKGFRHFNRYHASLFYDIDRVKALIPLYKKGLSGIKTDLNRFAEDLKEV